MKQHQLLVNVKMQRKYLQDTLGYNTLCSYLEPLDVSIIKETIKVLKEVEKYIFEKEKLNGV